MELGALVLLFIGEALAIVETARSEFKSLIAWGVDVIGAALILTYGEKVLNSF